MHTVRLNGCETWSVEKTDYQAREKNDATMVQWMRNVRAMDGVSVKEIRCRLQVNTMNECLLNRLLWAGHLETMKGNSLSSKCQKFEGGAILAGKIPRKQWSEVTRDLEKWYNSYHLLKIDILRNTL